MDARTRRIVGGVAGLFGVLILARLAPDFVAAVLMTFSFVVFVLALVGLVKPQWVRLPNRLAVGVGHGGSLRHVSSVGACS